MAVPVAPQAEGAMDMKLRRAIALALLLALALATPAMASHAQVKKVLSVAKGELGAPYALRSDAPNSFNCLSFVAYCFNQVESGTISSEGVATDYQKISSLRKVKAGDVVCFTTVSRQKGMPPYHFGICIGSGCFVHALSGHGVTVSRLKDYKKRFIGAMRIF